MAKTKTAPALTFDLPETPTLPVSVGGRTYLARIGSVAGALELPALVEAWSAFGRDGSDVEAMGAGLAELDARTRSLVAAVFGDAAAEELVGGEHTLDIPRIVAVLDVVARIYESDEAAAVIAKAAPVPDTADAD